VTRIQSGDGVPLHGPPEERRAGRP
jgi:hypothetical protein